MSEGTALGLLLCGRDSVPSNKVMLDLAFGGAWRSWDYASRFPQVNTDLRQGFDASRVMTRATVTKHTWALYWEQVRASWVIRSRTEDWDPADEDDVTYAVEVIDSSIPGTAWRDLAAGLLSHLDE